MTTHVMIDLETLGTSAIAAVVAIGAVKFDPVEDKLIDAIYIPVDPEDCARRGMRIDGGTVMWWMQPDRDAARAALLAHETRHDLASALSGFSSWYGAEPLPTWGNGATFDLTIMENAYRALGGGDVAPWRYVDQRCYRTIKSCISKDVFDQLRPKVEELHLKPPHDTAHDALYDAAYQAKHLISIARLIGMELR